MANTNSSTDNIGTGTLRKSYQDLTFTDDYMFCKILENDLELCRELLELILDKDIRKVELADAQHPVSITSDIRSVRLDVYLNDDEGTVFDLEMQASRKRELPRRSRYYHSIMDIEHLGTGKDYGSLPESYVIFICTFDPFDRRLPRYEFRKLCTEDASIELGDGTITVFINAEGRQEGISDDMRAFLDYLKGLEPESDLTKSIADSIVRAKSNKRWEREYVTVGEEIRRIEREAEERARRSAVDKMVEKLGISVEQACDILDIHTEDYYLSQDKMMPE